ncbi:MAG TPA: FG-GAP-like repeat-containing protein [Terriglobales bacterium]|nr:FG-GAP-like repeat-containing protein [Terriglobales bacterium]
MASDFSGASLAPVENKKVRSGSIEVQKRTFREAVSLARDAFVAELKSEIAGFARILTADFQITGIRLQGDETVHTRVLYEQVGTGADFHREQRVGSWDIAWRFSNNSVQAYRWRVLEESRSCATAPVFTDISSVTLGGNASYHQQLLHGSDYWRTILDGASGIDIYGHNGVSLGDIDNDGLDDLYVCQPAGLPNRLYRNGGDGTFQDITETSGVGILENTACALFADVDNDGRQDLIIVRTNGPVLFVNQGGGKFREQPDAFRFANAPQGTFTGAAIADYDRDGWLDVYFCLYAYYQGTDQYRYPSPYYDAQNGPPNFLMRNNRDGTFRDVTGESGLNQNNTRYSFCCAWADYDNDGWPDLYVVNDFGRKNLYRNNGDGTFTDVAAAAGAEDVGAGMSVSWFDFDNDGAEDLYVANMWTAAGERISAQEAFQKDNSAAVRMLYQKHAMGNSLLRNQSGAFRDFTATAGAGNGRWSWSSDAWDFDHDGHSDLYVTNGMISGPSQDDLNSFFWRQVVANSPQAARPSRNYEQGWSAINELVRADGTWSGYERNVFYANNGDGTFSDVSGTVGLDFVEDGRSFALADFDHDGRLEVFLKNRNGPQLRVLRNVMRDLPAAIAFRLEGVKSNRDAIGAVVTVETGVGKQVRFLRAGSGFLSQHTKELFFGLGEGHGPVHATIRWPHGSVQRLGEVPPNHRIWVKEGSAPSRLEPFRPGQHGASSFSESSASKTLPTEVSTWLLAPVLAPDFELPDRSGRKVKLSALRGQPVLLNLCMSESSDCKRQLKIFEEAAVHATNAGLKIVAVNFDQAESLRGRGFSHEHPMISALQGSEDVASVYNILYRYLFDRHRDLTFPISFLIDPKGEIVRVYQGLTRTFEQDAQQIPQNDAERVRTALPFPGIHYSEFGRNYLSFGSAFFQRGYYDQAADAFRAALRDDPSSAEARYGIGSVLLQQNKNPEAREQFEAVLKLPPGYPETLPNTWNNLGIVATREQRFEDAVQHFQRALELNPEHLIALDNLGNAYRELKQWDKAQQVLERAVSVAPEDPEANYNLGMVLAQKNDTARAEEFLKKSLQFRPDYPEALNNLGILYLRTERVDEAVALFEKCIQVQPGFDKSYLSLARVYAIQGDRDKARAILLQLLAQHPEHQQASQMLEQLKQ